MKGFIKELSAFVCMVSLLGGLSLGIIKAYQASKTSAEMYSLAEENGFEETVSMDEFMKKSEKVSQEEFERYNKLKEEEKKQTRHSTIGLAIMGVGGVGGMLGAVVADMADEEEEISF